MLVAGRLLFEAEHESKADSARPAPRMAAWQKALFVFTAGDIAAGAIANLTKGTSGFHANNDAGNARLSGFKFVCLHFLHAAGVYCAYKDWKLVDANEEWNRSLLALLRKCYFGQLAASSIVLSYMGFDYQRIIGWGLSMLMVGGIILDKSVNRPSLKYIMSLYTVKLVYAFSVDHDQIYRVSQ